MIRSSMNYDEENDVMEEKKKKFVRFCKIISIFFLVRSLHVIESIKSKYVLPLMLKTWRIRNNSTT